MNNLRPVKAEINLNNLAHNIRELRKRSMSKNFMAVVKADGYGHGAVPVAKISLNNGADNLGVATIQEGIELREAGIKVPILIFGWTPDEYAEYLPKYKLTQTVFSFTQAERLSSAVKKIGEQVDVHLKIDTGMNRLGFQINQKSKEEIKKIFSFNSINVLGIFTHFAEADNRASNYTINQYKNFKKFLLELESYGLKFPVRHCANSAAIIDYPSTHMDMVRAGISIYGFYPDLIMKDMIKLKPVMRLLARIAHIKNISAGETVSYGRTFGAQQNRKIATIPVGYADGYNRLLSNKGKVIIGDSFAPVVGRVCMDQFMVDITHIEENIQPGDEVILFGENDNGIQVSVDEIADITGTINYEIVCMVNKRVPRVYLQ
ncbi:MAG: hypothetical protein APF76_06080 [Desulfitibacter sp. BRH_c19]|nr:MAG: hypothetical protein APF76_06080 [Desulfitibacter sp. BRH_c19]